MAAQKIPVIFDRYFYALFTYILRLAGNGFYMGEL